MKTRYLVILVTVALLGFSVPAASHPCDRDDRPEHKHCNGGGGGGGGDSAEYTAELTMGGFIFGPEVVTPHRNGNSFKGDDVPLTLNRSEAVPTASTMAWDLVLGNCEALLIANGISAFVPSSSFDVKSGNWNISGDGIDIWMNFGNLDFGVRGIDIDISLGGVVGSDPVTPVCGSPSVFTLEEYSIFGQAKRGLPGPSCSKQEGLQGVNSVLVIERTDCP